MSGVRGMRWSHVKPYPSWGAYKRHLRSGETPREPCRRFVNDATAASRRARNTPGGAS